MDSTSSTNSDCSSSGSSCSEYSEPEVILLLASQNPKKRAGRKKVKETRHPVFRGIRQRSSGKWICEVRQPNKKSSRLWLGTYATADMAARAHDVAVLAMRGRSACLNFADSVWRLPVPESSNVDDIKKAAAEAAKAFGRDVVVEELPAAAEEVIVMNNKLYVDEEEMFCFPGFIANMAEGLMVRPPPQMVGYDTNFVDNVEDEVYDDMPLWSY